MPSFRSRNSDDSGQAVRRAIGEAVMLGRPAHAQHQDGGREIEAGDRDIGIADAEHREQSGAGQCADDARAVLRRARHADRADQLLGRHDVGQQRAAHAEVRRADQPHDRDDDHDVERRQMAGQRQRHDGRRRATV